MPSSFLLGYHLPIIIFLRVCIFNICFEFRRLLVLCMYSCMYVCMYICMNYDPGPHLHLKPLQAVVIVSLKCETETGNEKLASKIKT